MLSIPYVFEEKKSKWPIFQNGHFSKRPFFKIANSQIFFLKISQIGPLARRIDHRGLKLFLYGLIDAKAIKVAQPTWL